MVIKQHKGGKEKCRHTRMKSGIHGLACSTMRIGKGTRRKSRNVGLKRRKKRRSGKIISNYLLMPTWI